jgi:hypothetical protein
LAGVMGVLFAALLQPIPAPAMVANSSKPNSVFNLLRRKGIPKKNNAARATPPPIGDIRRSGSWTTALDTAVVPMVSVAVTGVVPEIAAGALTEQAGMSTAPTGLLVTVQLRDTVPVKPLLGVTVIVEVPLAPGAAMVIAVLLSAKLGATTVNEVVEMTAMPPSAGVPCTIIWYAPGVVAGSVETVAVALTAAVPESMADGGIEHVGGDIPMNWKLILQLSVTSPVTLMAGVTVTVEVALAPTTIGGNAVVPRANADCDSNSTSGETLPL